MRWMTPSGKIATGSPVSVEKRRTKPTHFFPGAEGIFDLMIVPARASQWMTSEFKRSATIFCSASPPSMDLKT
jgi:hypothetical protein